MPRRSFRADESLVFKLIRLVNLHGRPFEERLGRRHRISLNEWRVLLVASNHPKASAREIAELTGFDKMTVSRALGRLERAGRVARAKSAADRRRDVITLTVRGQTLVERIGAEAAAREQVLLAPLPGAARRSLARQIDQLTTHVLRLDRSAEG